MKKRWKKRCGFSQRRLFFSTWRPSRITVFYYTKATFSVFVFLHFFRKNVEKSVRKSGPQFFFLNSLKSRSGNPFREPNYSRIDVKENQKPKSARKSDFRERQFFEMIFCKKKWSKMLTQMSPKKFRPFGPVAPGEIYSLLIDILIAFILVIYLFWWHFFRECNSKTRNERPKPNTPRAPAGPERI